MVQKLPEAINKLINLCLKKQNKLTIYLKILLKKMPNYCGIMSEYESFFDRPCVVGAVPQTALYLFN